MILDFTDCKSVEDVNKKWLEYAKDIPPYKQLFERLEKREELTKNNHSWDGLNRKESMAKKISMKPSIAKLHPDVLTKKRRERK